jgi:hypothetical protein
MFPSIYSQVAFSSHYQEQSQEASVVSSRPIPCRVRPQGPVGTLLVHAL